MSSAPSAFVFAFSFLFSETLNHTYIDVYADNRYSVRAITILLCTTYFMFYDLTEMHSQKMCVTRQITNNFCMRQYVCSRVLTDISSAYTRTRQPADGRGESL